MNKKNVNSSNRIGEVLNEGTKYKLVETKAPAVPKPTSSNRKDK